MGVVGPLVLGTILALAFGGTGPSFTIGVVDLDRTDVSSTIVDELAGGLDPDVLTLQRPSSAEAARAAVADGELDAVIVLPTGYTDSLAGAPLELTVIGAAGATAGAAVGEAVAGGIAATVDQQRLAATASVAAGVDPTEVSEALATTASVAREDPGDRFDGALYFGPLAVFLFLGLAGTAKGVVRDEKEGVMQRLRSAPVSPTAIVAGNAGTVLVQGVLAAGVVVALSSLLFGAVWGQPAEVAVVLSTFVLSIAGLLGVVIGFARSEVQAESWTNVMAFTFAVLGGSFFGGALLPGTLGVIGSLTPNGAAMRALIDLGPGERSLADVWYLLAWMALVGVAGLLVGARLLQRRWR
jgi:ABC-2 type transport system permease protein